MPGRTAESGGGYRFGFNGHEKIDEIAGSGNSLDFGARIYNSSLGRFSKIDNFSSKYPDLSGYVFVANNPNIYIDRTGNIIEYANDLYTQTKAAQIQKLRSESVVFNAYYSVLEISPIIYKVSVDDKRVDKAAGSKGIIAGGFYNDETNEIVLKESSGTKALAEEFFHAFQITLIYGKRKMNTATVEAEAKVMNNVVMKQQEKSKVNFVEMKSSDLGWFGEESDIYNIWNNILDATEITDSDAYSTYTNGFMQAHPDPSDPYHGNISQKTPKAYNKVINIVDTYYSNDKNSNNSTAPTLNE